MKKQFSIIKGEGYVHKSPITCDEERRDAVVQTTNRFKRLIPQDLIGSKEEVNAPFTLYLWTDQILKVVRTPELYRDKMFSLCGILADKEIAWATTVIFEGKCADGESVHIVTMFYHPELFKGGCEVEQTLGEVHRDESTGIILNVQWHDSEWLKLDDSVFQGNIIEGMKKKNRAEGVRSLSMNLRLSA